MNAMKYVGKQIVIDGKVFKIVSVMPRRDGWALVRVVGQDRLPRLYDMTDAVLNNARTAYIKTLN